MKKQRGFTILEIFGVLIIALLIGAAIGWGQNLIKLAEADFEAPYKTEIIRSIGILPPVGAFVGYMDIGEEVTEDD